MVLIGGRADGRRVNVVNMTPTLHVPIFPEAQTKFRPNYSEAACIEVETYTLRPFCDGNGHTLYMYVHENLDNLDAMRLLVSNHAKR